MRRSPVLHAGLAAGALTLLLVPVAAADADDAVPAPSPSPSALASPSESASPSQSPSPSSSPGPTGNQPPLAVDDQVTVRQGQTASVDVLANDSDADGDALTVTWVGGATSGAVALADGVVEYTASERLAGTDSFTYVIADPAGGEATAVVVVTIVAPPEVSLRVPPRPHALMTYSISGRVRSPAGDVAGVRLLRWREGRWTASRPVTVDDGRFSRPWRPRTPGPVRWRPLLVLEDGTRTLGPVARSRVVVRLDAVVTRVSRADLRHSWRPGCPVGPGQLRSIRLTYRDFQGRLRRGTLIGSTWAVDDFLAVFRGALDGGFRFRRLYPVDRYRGNDVRSMAADNTSAFNCRHVTGNPYRLSRHSFGDAIDVNPFENPYATSTRIYPAKAALPFYHRRDRHLHDPGVITAGSPIAEAFFRRGWLWGARWSHRDYQHWSRNGG